MPSGTSTSTSYTTGVSYETTPTAAVTPPVAEQLLADAGVSVPASPLPQVLIRQPSVADFARLRFTGDQPVSMSMTKKEQPLDLAVLRRLVSGGGGGGGSAGSGDGGGDGGGGGGDCGRCAGATRRWPWVVGTAVVTLIGVFVVKGIAR